MGWRGTLACRGQLRGEQQLYKLTGMPWPCSTPPVGASSWISAVASSSLPSCNVEHEKPRRSGLTAVQARRMCSSKTGAVAGAAATHHCYNMQPARLLVVVAKYTFQQKREAVLKEATGVVSADHSTSGVQAPLQAK